MRMACLDSLLGLVDDRHDDVRTFLCDHGTESFHFFKYKGPFIATSSLLQKNTLGWYSQDF
jgi:hypothetical protein